jgi:hypothetical protein
MVVRWMISMIGEGGGGGGGAREACFGVNNNRRIYMRQLLFPFPPRHRLSRTCVIEQRIEVAVSYIQSQL